MLSKIGQHFPLLSLFSLLQYITNHISIQSQLHIQNIDYKTHLIRATIPLHLSQLRAPILITRMPHFKPLELKFPHKI